MMTGGVGFAPDSQNKLEHTTGPQVNDHGAEYEQLKGWRHFQTLLVEQWRWHLSWILLILSIITLVVGALIY